MRRGERGKEVMMYEDELGVDDVMGRCLRCSYLIEAEPLVGRCRDWFQGSGRCGLVISRHGFGLVARQLLPLASSFGSNSVT